MSSGSVGACQIGEHGSVQDVGNENTPPLAEPTITTLPWTLGAVVAAPMSTAHTGSTVV